MIRSTLLRAARLGLSVAAIALVNPVERAGAAEPPPGQWLVNRARSFALSGATAPTRAEAEYVLCWLKAAARVSPEP